MDRLAQIVLGVSSGALACSLGLAQPARLVADDAPASILRFSITDDRGGAMPGRLTFVRDGTPDLELFTHTQVRPKDLAVRRNVVYTLSGRGEIAIPPGSYTIYATRGLEYSRDELTVELGDGESATFDAVLTHEVDTGGWISGDYHLHTLTHSGHGDANMPERIISLIGEHVEFAVATDHNHNTDYGPTIDGLGATGQMAHVTGNEVSTPIGHFNAFPFDADRPVVNSSLRNASELFRLIRAEANRFGTVPVVQVNHPRWDGIDYFTQTGLDPLTGEGTREAYSDDFDTVEVFNENAGWGYFDPETAEISTASETHSVLRDWFNLLNRGLRIAAVGNSDSHKVHSNFAGYPRNYTQSDATSPGEIDPAHVADELRAMRVFTTTGPFVEFTVGGAAMGAVVAAKDGIVEVSIRVQAASWIDCDRVKIVVNGDVREVIEVAQGREPLRLETTRSIELDHDSWVAVLVEGDDSLSPILHDNGRAILPLAIANPVFIDVDGDGRFTSLHDWARSLAGSGLAELGRAFRDASPTERGVLALVAAREGHPIADILVSDALTKGPRETRLLALRGAEALESRRLTDRVLATLAEDEALTALERVNVIRAIAAHDSEGARDHVLAMLRSGGTSAIRRHGSELFDVLKTRRITEWEIVGPFDNPDGAAGLDRTHGPETNPTGTFATRAGERGWTDARTDERGYLDLRRAFNNDSDRSIAFAQAIIESDTERDVLLACGSDDGCRVWINGELVLRDDARQAASPFAHVIAVRLKAGANRIVVKIDNGGGEFGLYMAEL